MYLLSLWSNILSLVKFYALEFISVILIQLHNYIISDNISLIHAWPPTLLISFLPCCSLSPLGVTLNSWEMASVGANGYRNPWLLHTQKIRIGIQGRGKIAPVHSHSDDSSAVVMYWFFISDLMCNDWPEQNHGSPMVLTVMWSGITSGTPWVKGAT